MLAVLLTAIEGKAPLICWRRIRWRYLMRWGCAAS